MGLASVSVIVLALGVTALTARVDVVFAVETLTVKAVVATVFDASVSS